MSRSYRKPWVVDGWKGSRYKQFMKNYFNRSIRRKKSEIPNGKTYKKMNDRYSICDYRWFQPEGFNDWRKEREHFKATGEEKEFRKPWITNRK